MKTSKLCSLDPVCRGSGPHAEHWRPSPCLRLPAHFQGHHRLLRCPLLLPICRFLALCLHQKSRQKRVKVILFCLEKHCTPQVRLINLLKINHGPVVPLIDNSLTQVFSASHNCAVLTFMN